MEKPETTDFYRRHLPHWRVYNRPYFVTFCLKNSLPSKTYSELMDEYSNLKEENREDHSKAWNIHFNNLEAVLDKKTDNNYLEDPNIAGLIMNGFIWVEKNYKWKIPYMVIMPNHVHCLMIGDKANTPLEKTLKVLKGFTAREANKLLGKKGNFWISESFDHWCRSYESYVGFARYIMNNPVKAGLVEKPDDYKWLKYAKRTSTSDIPV